MRSSRHELLLVVVCAAALMGADEPIEQAATDAEPATSDEDRFYAEWIRRLAEENQATLEADASDAEPKPAPTPAGAKIYVPLGSGPTPEDEEPLLELVQPGQGPDEARIVGPSIVTVPGGADGLAWTLTDGVAPTDDLLDVVAVGSGRGWSCTGTLVASGVVLTARHCLPATRIAVASRAASPVLTVDVTRAVPHPTRDVALLFLARAPEVEPRPWRLADDRHPVSGYVRLAGFGSDRVGGRGGAGRKRSAVVTVDGWGCDRARARATGCQPGEELVIRVPERIDTCDGDSGGPAFEEEGGRWQLLGVTSRPIASATTRCGDGGIYTRVDRISDWMLDLLVREGIRPPARAQEAL